MISVCIVAKNEEKNISECIESVKNFASEIILVDNGSVDDTVAIAKKYGCVIINAENCIIDEAKKMYFDKAKYPWIFTIDADERCGDVNRDELYQFLENTDSKIWAYAIKEYQYIGSGKWSEISLIRLFRNNGIIKFNNSEIHATLIPSIVENGGEISEINIYMHHLDILIPNRTSNKREIYRDALERKLHDDNFIEHDKSSVELYKIYLSMEYNAIEKYEKSKEILLDIVSNGQYYREFAIIGLCRTFILTNELEKIPNYIDIDSTDLNRGFGEGNDMIDILGNYYFFKDKNIALKLYENLMLTNRARASDYINYAFIMKDIDFEKGKLALKKAIEFNPHICCSYIYSNGEKPNLFEQQSNFLVKMASLKDLMKYYKMDNLIR